jgi:probable phosphoglycerate mutase
VRLILIRHGESHHSFNGLIAGDRGCTGLTERGIAQSRALARRQVRYNDGYHLLV